MDTIVKGFQTPELLILLGLGLAVMLFGYRIKKIAFFIAWFLLGYIGTTNLLQIQEVRQILPEVLSTELYQILLPIGGGLLLALLGFSIEKLCVGGICFVLVLLTGIQYFGNDIQTIAISAVIGIIVAGAAVMLMKPATIIATAGVGAYATTLALLILTSIDQGTYYWPMLIGFTAVGAIFQFASTKHIN
jgi:hypothetical protein